jgi:hypothetical protein
MTASPLVLVQFSSDPGNWHATTGGVDIVSGNTVSIKLADTTDVGSWYVTIVGVDEVTALPPVLVNVSTNPDTPGLVVSPTSVVSFTSPVGNGRAYILRSSVNGLSSTTTFGIFVRTAGGFRVGAVGERFEGNPTFGWTTTLNQFIRTGAGGGGPAPALQTTTSNVDVAGATAPSAGQVLTASSSTAANWATPSSGVPLTTNAPANVTKSTADVGIGTAAARDDHKHDVSTATAGATAPGDSASEGTATSLARSDHKHSLPAFGTSSGTFCQGNDSRLSDDRTASGVRSATTVVSIASAPAPSAGQILTASSSTAAAWANPATPTLVERTPQQLMLVEVFNSRTKAWLDGALLSQILPPNLQWIDETFSDTTTTRFTTIEDYAGDSISISSNTFTATLNTGSGGNVLYYENTSDPVVMPQVFVCVKISSYTGTTGAYRGFYVGIAKDISNFVSVCYEAGAQNLFVQIRVAGTTTSYTPTSVTYSPGMQIGISITGDNITPWYRTSSTTPWTKAVGADISSHISLKSVLVSETWYPIFGSSNPGTYLNTNSLKEFKAGRFGGCGARDWTAITNLDGSPYLVGSTAYLTATLAGPFGGIEGGTWGVFTFNLETREVTQIGLIMNQRSSKIQGDHAGHIVYDSVTGDQHVLISTWGDVNTAMPVIQYQLINTSTHNFLNPGTGSTASYVMSGTTLNVTVNPGGDYDPYLVLNGSTWYLAYVATAGGSYNFWPALDSSSNLSTWTNVGSDPSATRYEGTKIAFLNSTYTVMAGGQYGMKCWDLTMAPQGWVGVVSPGDGTTQPHPQLVPYLNSVLMITFDQILYPPVSGDVFSWGSLRTFQSTRYL